eukprot:TRINITY_DN8735_c0_g1_i1.p2 TRINITY_DN8735_c0_g1~~TRINITY_DN8735_c0_g1_i1.p2  ORF type:complete len:131 (-),score=13.89 TRINITY_DN8735_c0_g1_i1:89-481(-)
MRDHCTAVVRYRSGMFIVAAQHQHRARTFRVPAPRELLCCTAPSPAAALELLLCMLMCCRGFVCSCASACSANSRGESNTSCAAHYAALCSVLLACAVLLASPERPGMAHRMKADVKRIGPNSVESTSFS